MREEERTRKDKRNRGIEMREKSGMREKWDEKASEVKKPTRNQRSAFCLCWQIAAAAEATVQLLSSDFSGLISISALLLCHPATTMATITKYPCPCFKCFPGKNLSKRTIRIHFRDNQEQCVHHSICAVGNSPRIDTSPVSYRLEACSVAVVTHMGHYRRDRKRCIHWPYIFSLVCGILTRWQAHCALEPGINLSVENLGKNVTWT